MGKKIFNNYIFSRLQNILTLGTEVTCDGRLFHTSAQAMGNDRSMTEEGCVCGAIRRFDDAEHNPLRPDETGRTHAGKMFKNDGGRP
jgi:hypothetical protein